MTTNKEDTKLGYDFEKELKEIFKELIATYPFFWHQFLDSKSAGRLVTAQPSDFLISSKLSGVCLLEAKASTIKKSLSNCAKTHIRPSQVGMHKKWHRAGNKSLFIFYSMNENNVELWDGEYITSCISNNKKPLKSEGLKTECDYFQLLNMLTNYFCKGY